MDKIASSLKNAPRNDNSVSIIVPAFNEEGNIEGAIDSVVSAVEGQIADYEVIVIDDGSRDQTAALVKKRALKNPRIKIFSNDGNQGYGFSFKRGVSLAGKAYVTVFPGDNDMASCSLRDLIIARAKAEVIITYSVTSHRRSWFRRILSKTFVVIMNSLFGMKLKYFNGAFICETKVLRSVSIKSNSLAVLAESIVRLIKAGHSYHAIAFEHTGRMNDKSKAITIKSLAAVSKTIRILVQDIYFPQPVKLEPTAGLEEKSQKS